MAHKTYRVTLLRTVERTVASRLREPIVRLRATTPYEVRAFALDAAGCPAAAATAQFVSGQLPSPLDRLALEASGRAGFPLAFMDLRWEAGDQSRMFLAVEEGEVVWFYLISRELMPRPSNGKLFSLVRLTNGNFLYLVGDYGLEDHP